MSSPDSDRNLLFAVLALQADCLSPTRFVEACTLWASQKSTPIADLLLQRGWITPDEHADVQRLLERKLAKYAGDAKAGLAEATADAAIRQSIAAIADDDVRGTLSSPPPPGHVLLSTSAFTPEAGERYTITRLHATGGIGRVWLARDATLGRDVALKELRPERVANSDVWARFMKEAQITGQLEHPGIVPIYELGTRGTDGPPFYTMRFVRGRTLREAIAAYHQKRERGELGPLDLRELLTAFVGVCNAVAYAHSRGVIHRDLKPANVVLGEFGEVMVLDWGLAKEVHNEAPAAPKPGEETTAHTPPISAPAGDSDSGGTLEGQVLGTPAYMAPEQADGRMAEIGIPTDVYGLGAILYEILTGKPPFDGPTTAEVLSRVRTLEPARPRDLVPKSPRPLEAVCLKALRKKPTNRYPSAKALADDVANYLADEPTTALRESIATRAWRTARKHRTAVTAMAVALLVAVPVLAGGLFFVNRSEQREREARQHEETARKDEQAAREQAQANYARSLRAADLMAQELARGVRPLAGTQTKNVLAILDRSKQVYDDLLSDSDASTEALERKAAVLILFAELYRDTNRTGASRAASQQSLDIYNRLLAERPDDRALRIGRARAHHRLAWMLFDQGYEVDSLAMFRNAAAELEAVGVDKDPEVAAVVLGSSVTFEGNLLLAFGDIDGAEIAYRKALAIRRKAASTARDNSVVLGQYALSLEKLGAFLMGNRASPTGVNPEGIAFLREARRELETVCNADAGNAALHLRLVQLLTTLGQVTDDRDESAKALEACQRVVDRFATRDPDHLFWQREAIRLRFFRTEQNFKTAFRNDAPNLEELRRELLQANESLLAITQAITRQDPENYLWTADVANFQRRVAEAHLAYVKREPNINHLAIAEENARASVATYDKLLARCPIDVDFARDQLGAVWVTAQVQEKQKDLAASFITLTQYHKQSVELYHKLIMKHPTSTRWGNELRTSFVRAAFFFSIREENDVWKVIATRPDAITAAVQLAMTLANLPDQLPAERKPSAQDAQRAAGRFLRFCDAKGVLPPEAKYLLQKLPVK